MGHKQKDEQKSNEGIMLMKLLRSLYSNLFYAFEWLHIFECCTIAIYIIALSVTALLHGIVLKAYWYGMQISDCFYSHPVFLELLCIVIINIILQTFDLTL